MMNRELKQRIAHPAFQRFKIERRRELIAAGMPSPTAVRFALKETEGRARASLQKGIDAALDAALVPIISEGGDDVRFKLVSCI